MRLLATNGTNVQRDIRDPIDNRVSSDFDQMDQDDQSEDARDQNATRAAPERKPGRHAQGFKMKDGGPDYGDQSEYECNYRIAHGIPVLQNVEASGLGRGRLPREVSVASRGRGQPIDTAIDARGSGIDGYLLTYLSSVSL